eukprot:3555494-Pleurochrysis_carterae.AAC.1
MLSYRTVLKSMLALSYADRAEKRSFARISLHPPTRSEGRERRQEAVADAMNDDETLRGQHEARADNALRLIQTLPPEYTTKILQA